jgi:predicted nucleic acid-binding protein
MIRAVLADTGPLYATNDSGDRHHQRSLRELSELARDQREVLIAYPILLETHSLLLFRLGRNAASSWLTEVADASFVSPAPEDYRHGVATLRTLADQSITLMDGTLAALALRLGLQVWTYDHHFDAMRVPVWRG